MHLCGECCLDIYISVIVFLFIFIFQSLVLYWNTDRSAYILYFPFNFNLIVN